MNEFNKIRNLNVTYDLLSRTKSYKYNFLTVLRHKNLMENNLISVCTIILNHFVEDMNSIISPCMTKSGISVAGQNQMCRDVLFFFHVFVIKLTRLPYRDLHSIILVSFHTNKILNLAAHTILLHPKFSLDSD